MAGSRRLTSLTDEVLQHVAARLPDGPQVVALSGGADSAVCAWAAARLGSPLRAVHVDHGWPASASLRVAALEIARAVGIDLAVVDVRLASGASPEGQARRARYAALAEQVKSDEYLLTGHTLDDHAETVLGNFLRGAGATGLAGIPARRGNIIRPMLDVTRSQARELAVLLGLPWVDDPTNEDTTLRRNALRRDIIPYLEARMNPHLRSSLVRMAAAVGSDDRFLDAVSATIPLDVLGETAARLPAPLLMTVPEPVAGRAIRRAIRSLSGAYPGSASDVATVLKVAGGGSPGWLSGSIRVERRGVWVVLERASTPEDPAAVTWAVPGSIRLGTWTLEAWIEDRRPLAFPLSHFAEVFDADPLPNAFTVRSARRSDRMAIVGGSKRVWDVLAEADVPPAHRSRWPVVVCQDAVLWVPGARRAASGWVGAGTRRYLWVRATVEGNS